MIEKVRCLVVDDAEENLRALESVLRGDDREIHTATSGPQALELLQAQDFALALLATHMSAMNGFELAELMRGNERSKHVPILFITGNHDEPLTRFRGHESGAIDVLFEPIDPVILRQKADIFFELYRQRLLLEQAVQARDDILAMVSHDLRTPLAVVHTTTAMLLNPKYQLTAEQVREQHERIRRNVDLMNRMVGDLMDVVSLRSGKLTTTPKPLVLNEVLLEAVTTRESAAREKGLSLVCDAGTEALRVDADRARLVQLFQNLIDNAVKSCKSGDGVNVTSRAQGGNAQIEIADSGPGIAADDLPHVFDPYSRPGREPQKTGATLGLYIARGIAEAHGGQIRCNSEPGVGTTFIVTLPLAS